VTIFTSAFDESLPEEYRSGIRVIRQGGKYRVYAKARRYVKSHLSEFDIIIDEINTVPFRIPKIAKGAPVLAVIHQLAREVWFYETRFPMNLLGYFALEPLWLRGYRKIPTVTVSGSTRNDLLDLGFERVDVIHNGISATPLEKPVGKESRPILIFIGRLVRCKRPEDAVAAFKLVRTEFPDAELWILGNGYLKAKLERKAEEGIRFFGRVNEKEKFDLLKKAHVLLAPSVREGWGISVIEANAMGTPAVGYDVPGLRDSIVDGVTGFLADPLSPESLAEATREILSDSVKADTLSRSALEWSKKFSWDGAATEFQRILESTIDAS
jgi:glycosyltransferase involved in cell wall biosynthesis